MTLTLTSDIKAQLLDEVRFFIESYEAEFTRYGLFDTVTTLADLERLFQFSPDLDQNLGYPSGRARTKILRRTIVTLVDAGHLIRFDDGPVPKWHFRSRMAEVARLTLKVRQRFRTHRLFTASKILVQDVHYEVRARRYPKRDVPFGDLWTRLLKDGHAGRASADELREVWTLLTAALDPGHTGAGTYSRFQMEAFDLLGSWLLGDQDATGPRGMVVGAGTGAGKTNTFFIPSLAYVILEKMVRGRKGVKAIAVYPRIKLAQNQLETFLGTLQHLNAARGDRPPVTIGIDYGDVLYARSVLESVDKLKKRNWQVQDGHAIFPAAKCPACEGELAVPLGRYQQTPPLTCRRCGRAEEHLLYVRDDWKQGPPDFYIAVTESLNNRLLDSEYTALFGEGRLADGTRPTLPGVLMLDEIHLHVANKGMQIGYLVRRLTARMRRAARAQEADLRLALVGLSATIAEPRAFFSTLTGLPQEQIEVVLPQDADLVRRGSEYFLFVKANAEERTGPMSTLLQSTMVLAHNMPQPADKRYLTLGFADSLDLVSRWKDQLEDAESREKQLFKLRDMSDPQMQAIAMQYFRLPTGTCGGCATHPDRNCVVFQEGECWWSMSHRTDALNDSMQIGVETSRRTASQEELRTQDLVVATSRLEVGYDDNRIMAVVQYQAPGDAASFIQRKGRAGREYGTYPVTLMVLNPFRAQDVFYFRNSHLLTSPVFKELPLNPDNRLVQRVHGFYAMFEHFLDQAGPQALSFGGLQPRDANRMRRWTQTPQDLEHLLAALQDALGLTRDGAVTLMASEDGVLREGLRHLVDRLDQEPLGQYGTKGYALMRDYLPQNFFSDINLPQLEIVQRDPGRGSPNEVMDLAPGIRAVLPGKVSWRDNTPYWVPPVLHASGRHRWYDLDAAWEVTVLPARATGQDVPRRLKRRLDLTDHQRLSVLRPQKVTVERFNPKRSSSSWYLAPEPPGSALRDVQRQYAPDRLDARSVTYGLTFDRVTFSEANLAPGMVFESSAQVAPTVFGPYRERLLRRVRLADCRMTPMTVLRATVGADMALKWMGGIGYSETFGFQHGQEACLLGYELSTEGVAFDLTSTVWTQNPSLDEWADLPLRAFTTLARLELQTLGVNSFTGDKLLSALLSVWGQHDRRTPVAAADRIEAGAWRPALLQEVEVTYRFKPDTAKDVMALYDQEDVRVGLAGAWRTSMNAQDAIFRNWVWDVRVLSLAQAILLAAQNIAGVEVGQQLSVKAPLRQDEGRTTHPSVYLFEDGIGGLGVARSLHEQLKSSPLAFWDAVEHQLNHCPVGDEEDLLLGLLACPDAEVEGLAERAYALHQADTVERRQAELLALQQYGRRTFGLDLTPAMIKGVLRVFTVPVTHWEQRLSNWHLYREINVTVRERFRTERGAWPNEQELTAFVSALLEREPQTIPALNAINHVLNATETAEWQEHLRRVHDALARTEVRNLYQQIPSLEDVERLSNLGNDARRAELTGRYSLTFASRGGRTAESLLEEFDENYFQADEHLLWAQSCWSVTHGQEEQIKTVYLNERDRSALHREVTRRYLHSCRPACPNCLENAAVAFADRPLLDRRLAAQSLRALRAPAEVHVQADLQVDDLLQRVRQTFRQGEPRCFLVFELAQQPLVNAILAQLGEEGVRLEVGRHAVAVVTSTLRSLGLPTHRPLYEVGLELGDPR